MLRGSLAEILPRTWHAADSVGVCWERECGASEPHTIRDPSVLFKPMHFALECPATFARFTWMEDPEMASLLCLFGMYEINDFIDLNS